MNIKKFQTGPLGANCYVVSDSEKNAVVIDVGGCDKNLTDYIDGLNVRAILLTHGHFDHIGGAAALREKTGAKIYIHKYDGELTSSREKSLASWIDEQYFAPFEADKTFFGGDVLKFGDMEFKVMHSPGHTRGSSCFITKDNMFCGDAVFCGSIGRSDVYGSDPEIQRQALKEFKNITTDYKMFCGHGEDTTLFYELKTNPFLMR